LIKHSMKLYISLKKFFGRKFRRYVVNVNRNLFRPSSSPFISGDSFRKYADFIFDETQSFNPNSVNQNDIIFLKTDLKEIYFRTIHPKIKAKYILITHNSDENIEQEDKKFLDDKIIHWFAQNLSFTADKHISPLPIGFENRYYLNNGKLKILKNTEENKGKKENKILSSFNVNTNYSARNKVLESVSSFRNIETVHFDTPSEYFLNLKNYKFLICPEGNGKDTHRIWEGLLSKTIPIVLKNEFSNNLKSLGIPLFVISDWDELRKLSTNFISEEYEIYMQQNFEDYTKLNFWTTKIDKMKII